MLTLAACQLQLMTVPLMFASGQGMLAHLLLLHAAEGVTQCNLMSPIGVPKSLARFLMFVGVQKMLND